MDIGIYIICFETKLYIDIYYEFYSSNQIQVFQYIAIWN